MADNSTKELQRVRPSEQELLGQWRVYMSDPALSLASLKKQADEGKLLDRGLRSLSWRYFFSLLPSPTPLPSTSTAASSVYSNYSLLLSHSRSGYIQLRERYLRAPDGKWVRDDEGEEDGEEGGEASLSSSAGSGKAGKAPLAKVDVKHNNPLSLEEENPWQSWFADLELRKTIRQDVLRTFPEVDYFRLKSTQDRLTNLLFIYTKLNEQTGYRQGMHELLAPLLWSVDFDSVGPSDDSSSLPHLVLGREWVEHDAWGLLSALMKSAQVYYDHQPSSTISPKPQSAFPPPSVIPAGVSAGLVQPIVSIASHLQSLLSVVDPPLSAAFTNLDVEPQLYAIRWLRLIFSREFPLPDTLLLWDALFARDPSLHLTTHISLALLLRIRGALIPAAKEGYGEFLQILLRYPPSPDGHFHTSLLVRQAIHLRDNLSTSGAEHVIRQNIELGVAVGEELPMDEALDLRSPTARGAHRRAASVALPTQGLGFALGGLAKGVYGRAEAMGITGAVTGAFNEIKRDFAEAQAQLEEQRRLRGQYSQFPSYPTAAPLPATKDALSDLAKMRASSLAMSSAIDLCVAVLERELVPPTPVGSPQPDEANVARKTDIPLTQGSSKTSRPPPPPLGTQTMALTALKHVRDVLGGQAVIFDPSVLEPLKHVLDGSPPAGPALSFPPPTTFSSPPLPPLPTFETSPQPSPAPQLAPSPTTAPLPSNSPAAVATTVPAPAPLANTPSSSSSASTSASSLLLGSRAEKPITALSRAPQPPAPQSPHQPKPRTAHDPLRFPPPASPSRTAYPASAPPASPPRNPSFPVPSFSTRPASSSRRPPSSSDPLGAL